MKLTMMKRQPKMDRVLEIYDETFRKRAFSPMALKFTAMNRRTLSSIGKAPSIALVCVAETAFAEAAAAMDADPAPCEGAADGACVSSLLAINTSSTINISLLSAESKRSART